MTKKESTVSLGIIALIVALPQLSETVYTPALPEIARALGVSESWVEATLTIYLVGFAVGVAIWGNLSDRVGRKPALLAGLGIYVVACLGCWLSNGIGALMFWRFTQALGASTGSVLGQAIARDSIPAASRGKAFSTISMAMAFAPAVGPAIGGFCAEYAGWSAVFLALLGLGLLVMARVAWSLPETHKSIDPDKSLWAVIPVCAGRMVRDRRLLGLGFMVGTGNGMLFGYFAEGPFYFIKMLGMNPSHYGVMSLFIAAPLVLGGFLSRWMLGRQAASEPIIRRGCLIAAAGSLAFLAVAHSGYITATHGLAAVAVAATLIGSVIVGLAMIMPNCLGHALENYSGMAGTAASLFGCYYYLLISAMTYLMALMHNGTVTRLPLFFALCCGAMLMTYGQVIAPRADTRQP